jgi:hypothetical protein
MARSGHRAANGTVLRSTDDGRSWAPRSIADAAALDLRDIEAVSATTAFAMVAGADTARIYRTTDGGKRWVRQYDDTRKGVFLDGIAFWDASNGLAVGDPLDGHFLVLRTNDGTRWTELSAAASPKAGAGRGCLCRERYRCGSSAREAMRGSEPEARANPAQPPGFFARAITGRTWQASSTPDTSGQREYRGSFHLPFVTR